jgi:hypothetical protein
MAKRGNPMSLFTTPDTQPPTPRPGDNFTFTEGEGGKGKGKKLARSQAK